MGRTVCTEPQCLYSRAIPLLPSVPVQYSYTSTPPMDRTACSEPQSLYSRAKLLLPLWTVRPVQSLSACTVELYLYSPYGPYGLYTVSVPVQYSYTSTPPMDRTAYTEPQCLYSRARPQLPLWAVRPVQILSACTRLHFIFLLIVKGAVTRGGAVVLRHCAKSQKVTDSIPDCVIRIIYWCIPSGYTMNLGLTQPLTEITTRHISCGGKGFRCIGLTILPPSCVECLETRASYLTGTLRVCPSLYRDYFPSTLLTFWRRNYFFNFSTPCI